LREVLLAIKVGDAVTRDGIVNLTGLSAEMVIIVLEALTRAELFQRTEDHVFIRRSVFDASCLDLAEATAHPQRDRSCSSSNPGREQFPPPQSTEGV
jgi:hypothetical protein